nr:MAG TPA: hypothetical protein [Caudoviricetes sp.]
MGFIPFRSFFKTRYHPPQRPNVIDFLSHISFHIFP